MVLENRLIKFIKFLALRADSHAQFEIREYANVMMNTVAKWVPTTYDAFIDYRVGGLEILQKEKLLFKK